MLYTFCDLINELNDSNLQKRSMKYIINLQVLAVADKNLEMSNTLMHEHAPFCAERAARPKFNHVVYQVKEQM